MNVGTVKHNFTSEAFALNEDLAPGAILPVTLTLPESGSVPFFCRFHSGMGGSLRIGG